MRTDAGEVLGAAIPVLVKDRSASMQTVAAKAGISRATLLRLFPSRRDLVSAASAKILSDCERALEEAGAAEGTFGDAMTALARDFLPFAQMWGLIYVEPDALGVPGTRDRADEVFDRIVEFAGRGQRAGFLRQDMPATWLAASFCGTGETAWGLILEGQMGARQAPDFVATMLLKGAGS